MAKHMGASTSGHAWKYPHKARCIYSGNTGVVYSRYEEITEPWQQDRLNNEFMRRHCRCDRCTEKKEDTKRIKRALEANGDMESLKALGW